MHYCFLDIIYDQIKTVTFLLVLEKLQVVAVHREIDGDYLHWGAEMIHWLLHEMMVRTFSCNSKINTITTGKQLIAKRVIVPISKTQIQHFELN